MDETKIDFVVRQIKQEARSVKYSSVNYDLAELILVSSGEVTNNLESEPVNSESYNRCMVSHNIMTRCKSFRKIFTVTNDGSTALHLCKAWFMQFVNVLSM